MAEELESGFYGRYQLIEKIASGGMAEVFKAKYHTFGDIEKTVIVKRILPQYTDDDEFVKMFVDEAKISIALSHTNLVHTFDFGQIDGAYYLAMEYIEGADLQSVLRECHFRRIPIPMELSVLLVAEVLRGLDYAHRRIDPSTGKGMGIVHRDISPANIMIGYSGNVKVMDFGIAKAKTKTSSTQVGTLKGKYSYMSPEQARGEDVDFRSDIFSCGIILYELVTGVRPFRGRSELEILERVKSARFDPPKTVNPHIPDRLAVILEQALAQKANDRFNETAIFCDRLNAMMVDFEERPDSSRLAKFLRKVFAEDGKKNRTDLSALVEQAVEQESRGKTEEIAVSRPRHTDELPVARTPSVTPSVRPEKSPPAPAPIRKPARSRVVEEPVTAEEPVQIEDEPVADGPPMEFAVAAIHINLPEGEDAEQRLREFLAVVEDEVVDRGGRIERRSETGLIAYYEQDGSEIDYRLRAVETARKAADLGRRAGSELSLTAGVCAGMVDRGVTQASVKAMQSTIRRAERLSIRADGVGVLIDEEVAQNIGEGFVLRRVGESDGSPCFAPVRAATKDKASRATRAGATSRTLGRDAERARLNQRLEEVIGGAGARSVALTGPVGIGKSHMVHDLLRAAATKGATVVVGRCVAAGRHVPFSVFNDLMRDLLGLPDGAGKDIAAQRLARIVTELNLAPTIPTTLKPLYAGARSVTADQVPNIASALREILGGMAANNKSIVLVVEDLHFADEGSRAVVGGLIDILRRERVLVLVTARTDVDDGWLKVRKGMDEIRLASLDDKSLMAIAMERMQLPTLSPELSDFLRKKSKGNPYYLLETIRRLNEKGLGAGGAGGKTHRQESTEGNSEENYNGVVARPKILPSKQADAVNRAKDAMAPQIKGFAEDIRRAISFLAPVVGKAGAAMGNALKTAKKVKKDYDPKTTENDEE